MTRVGSIEDLRSLISHFPRFPSPLSQPDLCSTSKPQTAMANSPSHSPSQAPAILATADPVQYWCYHCEKRVSVETVANLPDIICLECKNGFVESIVATSPPPHPAHPSRTSSSDFIDEPSFGSQFLQVLRLIARASREEDAPPPPPPDANSEGDDFLRIELDGWDNDDDNEDDDDEDENEVEYGNAVEIEEDDRSDDENEQNGDNNQESDEDEDEEGQRRSRRDVVRLRIRDIAARATSGRNRFLDWADILTGLEDNSIELRLEMPEHDGYIGNPEDYVDAAGYEALLQNLADSDQSGRRGAPPAAKSAISALPTVVIASEEDCVVCAICRNVANVGDNVKKLPCGHGYHGDCIVPWLGSRNSCPVCRFELPTDDPEYEEEKKKKFKANVCGASGSG